MARKKDKQKAIVMRQKGMSYSQIEEKIKVSKSTLSEWLRDMPLSEKRIRELRADSPIRIERYRNTMKAKKDTRLEEVYKKVSKDINKLSKRDLFLAGLFLYWGEGTKAQNSLVAITNTNPAMVKFFIKWLELFGIRSKDLKVKIHLYSDMDTKAGLDFWSKELKIPLSQFYKPYIKKTNLKSITYKNGFGKGTCSVILGSRDLWEYIMMALRYISKIS
ncbi:MAG: helix-turn-helix domain-containing protein [Burkholderiales bacterium]|nr:helix-turn-helix domain-containing protein [Burkholderiales bacterium]